MLRTVPHNRSLHIELLWVESALNLVWSSSPQFRRNFYCSDTIQRDLRSVLMSSCASLKTLFLDSNISMESIVLFENYQQLLPSFAGNWCTSLNISRILVIVGLSFTILQWNSIFRILSAASLSVTNTVVHLPISLKCDKVIPVSYTHLTLPTILRV